MVKVPDAMRTKKSIRNIATALAGQFFWILINFFARMVFIKVLGTEYLGVHGLFTNIISMISLAEMGIGSAIIYSLYKPLALGEEQKIKALMHFFRSAYHIIGLVVLVLGLAVLPFLDFIIKDKANIPNLSFIYLLFLADAVLSYFFAYKRSLIEADQKGYIVTTYHYIFVALINGLQIVVLLLTKNFIFFMTVKMLFTLTENFMISLKAEQIYPFLKEKSVAELDATEKKGIYQNVYAMFFHRLGGVVVNGTDNILISYYAGLVVVGLYSNYYMILTALNAIIGQIFTAATASIGNLNALVGKEKSYVIYKAIYFANFWFYGFSSICLYVLFNPFITLWVGKEFIMSDLIVTIIVINFFVTGMRKSTLMFRDSLGLFWNDRYKPLFESIINLVASIILASRYGIVGVLVGTFISTMTTCFWVEPYVLYRNGFNSRLREYFSRYGLYALVTLVAGFVTWYACGLVGGVTITSFVVKLLICLLIPNVIFLLIFSWTKEFKYLSNIVMRVIKKA